MRRMVAFAIVIGVVAASCSGQGGETTVQDPSSSTSITIPEDTEKGIVSGIISGDTVRLMIGDEPRVVRLAGIRAPQGDECFADEASLAVSEVTAGRNVAVVGDATDDDGTPLRYVIIEDDVPLLINVELVDLGAAAALHGHELAGDFLRVNDQAYASGKGMWGTFVCGHPEEGVSPDRPQLRIEAVHIPAAGEAGAGSVDIVNASYTEVAMGGWTIRDVANASSMTFPGSTVLAPGDVLSVAMTCDEEGSAGLTWCVGADLWSDGGNTLIIQDALGNVVERHVHEVAESP